MKFKKFIFPGLCVINLVWCACKKENPVAALESCNLSFSDSSNKNPKAKAYQSVLDKFTREKGLPGLVALVYTPQQGVWVGSSGFSQVENNIPMQPCNVFMSASVAKLYHAVLVLKMQEAGLLSLNDKIDRYLTEDISNQLPNGHLATIKTLLNHSSGIPNPTEQISFLSNYINNFKGVITPEKHLSYIYGKKPLFSPGDKFSYSDANYTLAAKIIDKIYGDHGKAMTDFIIRPTALNETYYRNEPGYKSRKFLVNSYADFYDEKILRNVSEEERIFNESNIGHDGFKYTVHDCFLFIKNLFIDRTILSQASLDQMLNDNLNLQSFYPNERALLGAFQLKEPGRMSIGHEGQTIGSSNFAAFYPDKKGIMIICSNFGGAASFKLYKTMFDRKNTENCLLREMEFAAF
jgi:D-alanyl-D-alanine carboxypeptidase